MGACCEVHVVLTIHLNNTQNSFTPA